MPLKPEDRKLIFETLKAGLQKCCPPMVIQEEKKDSFGIMGNKPVPYGSKKTIVPGMYFSSVVARKDMVSFYFFPIYLMSKEFDKVIPTVKKQLRGKSCFNFKKPEQVVTKELDAMLKKGVEAWKKIGYMK